MVVLLGKTVMLLLVEFGITLIPGGGDAMADSVLVLATEMFVFNWRSWNICVFLFVRVSTGLTGSNLPVMSRFLDCLFWDSR